MTSPRPASPRPVRPAIGRRQTWIVCQRCYHGGVKTRPYDPQTERVPSWCEFCDPDPETLQARTAEVNGRVQKAKRDAAGVMQAPDDRHVWLYQSKWFSAHLLRHGSGVSYCGNAELGRLAHPDDRAASRRHQRCQRCAQAYQVNAVEAQRAYQAIHLGQAPVSATAP